MKPRSNRFFPRTLVVCVAPLIASAVVHAEVVNTSESNGSGVWTLPSGTNLLTGRAPAGAAATHELSSTDWNTVVDGTLGAVDGNAVTSVTPNNGNTVTFALDLTSKPGGYNITSFDSYCTWGNSGRDNQNYMLQYSTVGSPGTFITIATVNHGTARDRSTHERLTDTTGFLATGVHSVRLIFDRQENGYVGYREFVLKDDTTVVTVDNRNRDNDPNWEPLVGPNLLNGATAIPATAVTHEGSSSSWTKLTDGLLGTAISDSSGIGQSVTPNNGNTVVFPLDTVAKPAGYDITSFESHSVWGSNGRDDQKYTLEYSTVGTSGPFLPITDVFNHTEYAGDYSTTKRATRTRIMNNNGTPLALGVKAIRVTFAGDQENGYTGFREFILRDTAPVRTVVKQSSNSNVFTLPSGTNLLANALPKNPTVAAGNNHGPTDVTSADWNVLTDGSLGSAGVQNQAVGPNNGTFVEFPLDTSSNTKGYTLSSLDTFASWGDSGRDNQNFTVSYAKVDDPLTTGVDESLTFIPIETVSVESLPTDNYTHYRISATSGNLLGTNVGKVRFDFANQENSWVGFREFVAQGSAVPLFSPLTWSGFQSGTWNATDNNWKDGASASPYNTLAPLTFDSTGANNVNINIPAPITAASVNFTNDGTKPYSFVGDVLTVTNGITLSGSGTAKFDNSITTGNVAVSGSGSLTLSVDNTLSGNATVSSGSLVLASDAAIGTAALTLSGGSATFKSALPILTTLSGTGGTVYLGNAGTSGHTDLYLGTATSSSYGGSITNSSVSATGSLVKVGSGTLTLTGANSYSGSTSVTSGELKFGKRLSLYNGNIGAWTAANILVSADATLGLRVGGAGEFSSLDVASLSTGGFDPGAILGLDTSSGDATISDVISSTAPILKTGVNSLILTGANTFTGGITVSEGNIVAANPSGASIPGDLTVGNILYHVFVNMGAANQFGPASVLKFNNGPGALNAKVQLRGFDQTVAGLESGSNNRLSIIQSDETGSPGYTTDPGPATLTINTAADHSFKGLIRNQNGGAISVVKKGLAIQEFVNTPVAGFSYNGPTTIEAGMLRLNFAGGNTGFGSNVQINSGATFSLRAAGGNNYNFDRLISGPGKVEVDGVNAVVITNNVNTNSGGTTVGSTVPGSFYGFLAYASSGNGAAGAGDGPGQYCAAGEMIPSNVVTVNGGATLSLDGAAPLGQSTVIPAFAPSIRINEGSRLFGGTNTIAFVSNITLDGGQIQVSGGSTTGAFNSNLCLVGTVVVPAGSSTVASSIFTPPDLLPGGANPSTNANVSLGSAAAPGTTFDVADVTSSAAADLTISSTLRNVSPLGVDSPSALTKTGPGTLALTGPNTYTGTTTVTAGVLSVNGISIPDGNKLVMNGGKLAVSLNETVGTLFYGGIQQAAGTYGSTSSGADHQDDTRFSGNAVLVVTTDPVTDPYPAWASVITNPDDRDRGDDPDGDGLTNLQEYLFGTSPIANTGSLSTSERSGNNLIIRWCQRTPGTYVLKESTTLVDPWSNSPVVPTNDPDQTGLYSGDYVRRQAVVPIDSAKKFLKVQATE